MVSVRTGVVLAVAFLLASVGCGDRSAEQRLRAGSSPDATRDGTPGSGESRRVAVPQDSTPAALRFCSAFDLPSAGVPAGAGMVLYGQTGRDDPYLGPMLGVVWGTGGDHAGDGTRTPVRVRGRRGEAAPITVFQQAVLEELGTVIAWHENDLSVGLYGRFWDADRTDELVALANELEFSEGTFRLPPDELPPGYGRVFAGDPGGLGLILSPLMEYDARYQTAADPHAVLRISGLVRRSEEFETVRFFGHGLEVDEIGGRRALIGNAWHEDSGPAVVTWREDDGLVVRVVGLGVEVETALEAARASRELSEEEWDDLVAAPDRCPSVVPQPRDHPRPESPPEEPVVEEPPSPSPSVSAGPVRSPRPTASP